MSDPCVVNKFLHKSNAIETARLWSKERREMYTVIHGLGEGGLAYFVEKGDGGMIRSNETVVARFENGLPVVDE